MLYPHLFFFPYKEKRWKRNHDEIHANLIFAIWSRKIGRTRTIGSAKHSLTVPTSVFNTIFTTNQHPLPDHEGRKSLQSPWVSEYFWLFFLVWIRETNRMQLGTVGHNTSLQWPVSNQIPANHHLPFSSADLHIGLKDTWIFAWWHVTDRSSQRTPLATFPSRTVNLALGVWNSSTLLVVSVLIIPHPILSLHQIPKKVNRFCMKACQKEDNKKVRMLNKILKHHKELGSIA